ncbi:thioredoxin [Thiocapsa imhoffii]|uniref:Thioredoxin n=1 Tax=Thiocapsa imhoffii TaxID=382777 RepID=A0A9X1BAV3_9GAMM|nr:thioredoxin [Thiocapsa imhoffii]MBK1646295.1 thioredoxin [Thiocapsa imhoffii]
MADSPDIVTVTAETFQSIVLDGSFERPVLVDFWADWCAPCRMLMPILAKLAEEYHGRFLLAKVNTEEQQALAAEFGIRSLPTVQLFKAGQPIDQFMGALPEGQIRDFIDRHIPRPSDRLLEQAEECLANGDIAGAERLVERIRAEDPENSRVALAEIQLMTARGELGEATHAIERLPLELANEPEVLALRGQLRFAAALTDAPSEADVTADLARDPANSLARYQLSAYQVFRGDYEAALENLLTLMRRDRAFQDDAARKGMLAIFDLLGTGDLVARYRAKMMNALY